jgi:hypothetical protein
LSWVPHTGSNGCVRDIHLRDRRSTVESQTPALVCGLGTDLQAKPGQRRQVRLILNRDQIKRTGPDEVKSLDLVCADREPGPHVLDLPLADGQQGLSMGERQVRVLLGRAIITNLKDQVAAGLLDLHECAVARLIREVAL